MPYSKWQSVTVPPFGFTVAFSVAEDCVCDDAEPVTTVGGCGGASTNAHAAHAATKPTQISTQVNPSALRARSVSRTSLRAARTTRSAQLGLALGVDALGLRDPD